MAAFVPRKREKGLDMLLEDTVSKRERSLSGRESPVPAQSTCQECWQPSLGVPGLTAGNSIFKTRNAIKSPGDRALLRDWRLEQGNVNTRFRKD